MNLYEDPRYVDQLADQFLDDELDQIKKIQQIQFTIDQIKDPAAAEALRLILDLIIP